MTIITNMIKCTKCNDVIESKNRHDFVWCSCKSVAVDGGTAYLRRLGDPGSFIDLSKVIHHDDT
jgi:hypothetical protein